MNSAAITSMTYPRNSVLGRAWRRVGGAAALALAIAACGGGSNAGPAPTPAPPSGDTVPPSTPAGLMTTVVSDSRIDVSWQAATDNVGVVAYRVLRNGAAAATVSATSYSSTGLTPATAYSFAVQALDGAGNASAASAAVSATTAPPAGGGRMLTANPTNYAAIVPTLKAGDTLVLEPGIYRDSGMPGLRLRDLNGTAAAPITIMGDPTKPRPVLQGRGDVNTVRFGNSSYIVLRWLEVDSLNLGGDGVRAEAPTHHITLEDLVIKGVGPDQLTVGISTNGGTSWNWIIRRCVIDGAGTGLYLGNSPGDQPFIGGIIENNLVTNSLGYNMQIKHQLANFYPNLPGMPTGPSVTIIRNNVFHKSANSSGGGNARPNLLVGAFPASGPGSSDRYEIYGNLLFQNPTEALFQGEGTFAFHHNLLVNTAGSDAVVVMRHNGDVRNIDIFNNTILASGSGIRVSGGAAGFTQRVIGNAVFAATPISGGVQTANLTDSQANAGNHVSNATPTLGQLDLYPRTGAMQGAAIDAAGLSGYTDWNRDFNRQSATGTFRGAYSGSGTNPGWKPQLAIRP